jgi:hypothetical protein
MSSRRRLAAATAAVMGIAMGWGAPGTTAQPAPSCDARRTQAIQLARTIHTAQMKFSQAKERYRTLTELKIVPTDGLNVQFIGNDAEYVFSIKDQSPCGVVVFSDQEGLIYTAQPLE